MSSKNTHFPNGEPAHLTLIEQAQGGDQAAFESLLASYTPLVESMVQSSLNSFPTSIQDYDDIRQEAILGFYGALMHYNIQTPQAPFGLYAKRCIKNRLISFYRAQQKGEGPLLADGEEWLEQTEDVDGNPVTHVVREENYRMLTELIQTALSPYENRIWWLYLSGRTAKEIAAQIGRDERSVQNAVYRIRHKLREIIPNPY